MPALHVAKQWQRRPTASIMGDDWFGHRDWRTGREQGDKDEWTEWDYLLARALQTIETHTDSNGLLIYEVRDDRVVVDAIRKIDKFEEAKDRITSRKGYKPASGEYFIPRLDKRSEEWPTMAEYYERLAREGETGVPDAPDPNEGVQVVQ